MNKATVLSNLRAAKSSLVEWQSYVQAYASGLSVDTRHLPIISTDSRYGKWYITEASGLSWMDTYGEIYTPLQECFNRFQALHNEISNPVQGGVISCAILMGKRKKVQKSNIKTLSQNVYLSIDSLINITSRLEEEVNAMPAEQFKNRI